MLCSLDKEINKCEFLDNELCKNKNKCSFQVSEENMNTYEYVREERWYEKYYRK